PSRRDRSYPPCRRLVGFGVRSLGFGVWGLGFGVWGSEFGARSCSCSCSFAVHRSPFTVHRSPFTVHRSPFTVHRSPFPVPLLRSRFAVRREGNRPEWASISGDETHSSCSMTAPFASRPATGLIASQGSPTV